MTAIFKSSPVRSKLSFFSCDVVQKSKQFIQNCLAAGEDLGFFGDLAPVASKRDGLFSDESLTALWDDLTNSYELEGYINQYECQVGRVGHRILKTGLLVQTIENGPFYLVSLAEFNRLYTQEGEKEEGRPFFNHQTQNHHILPKFAGGTDEKSNLIRIEFDDHCLFHFIRFKTFEFSPPLEGEDGYKRSWDGVAFAMMAGTAAEKRAANVERARMSQAKQKREGINWYNPEKQRELSLRPSAKRDAARRAVGAVTWEKMSLANQSEVLKEMIGDFSLFEYVGYIDDQGFTNPDPSKLENPKLFNLLIVVHPLKYLDQLYQIFQDRQNAPCDPPPPIRFYRYILRGSRSGGWRFIKHLTTQEMDSLSYLENYVYPTVETKTERNVRQGIATQRPHTAAFLKTTSVWLFSGFKQKGEPIYSHTITQLEGSGVPYEEIERCRFFIQVEANHETFASIMRLLNFFAPPCKKMGLWPVSYGHITWLVPQLFRLADLKNKRPPIQDKGWSFVGNEPSAVYREGEDCVVPQDYVVSQFGLSYTLNLRPPSSAEPR